MLRPEALLNIHSVTDLENMFQANGKVTCIILNEAILVFLLWSTLKMFLCAKAVLLHPLRGASKNNSTVTFRKFHLRESFCWFYSQFLTYLY